MKAVSFVVGLGLAIVLIACGGGGASTGGSGSTAGGTTAGGGTFSLLSNPPGRTDPGMVTSISDAGLAVGDGYVSIPGFGGSAALIWQGGTCVAVTPTIAQLNRSEFYAISPDGQWITGRLISSNVSLETLFRYNVTTQTSTLAPGPATGKYTSVEGFRTHNDSSADGELTWYIGNTGTDNRFTYDAAGSLSLTSGEYLDGYVLNPLPGGGAARGGRLSNSGNFVIGVESIPLGPSMVDTAILWDTSTGNGVSLGYLATNNFARSEGDLVSDNGVVVLTAPDNAGILRYCLWDSTNGLRSAIDFLHSKGFAAGYSWCTVDAISANGKYIGGSLGHAENDRKVAFLYQFP